MVLHRARQYASEDPIGVSGGVAIALLFLSAYSFGYQLIYVGDASPWRTGRLGIGDAFFINSELHFGLLFLPGLLVSATAFLLRRHRYDKAEWNEDRLFFDLVVVPLAVGVLIGIVITGILIGALLIEGSETVYVIPLALAAFVGGVVYEASQTIILIGGGTIAGYLLTRTILYPVSMWALKWKRDRQ